MFEVHPLADLIPAMSDEEYVDLAADIAANGLHEPITLYEGKVLDGRHRARACDELGIEPKTTSYEGDSPAAYVISLNVKRRQLSAAQRAVIALETLPYLEEEARRRQAHGMTAPGVTAERSAPAGAEREPRTFHRATDDAGALVGVSGRAVQRAKRVRENRPDLIDQIKDGTLSLNTAEAIAKGEADEVSVPTIPPPPPVYEMHTDRQRQLATATYRRTHQAIATFTGTAEGLAYIKVPQALAVATDDEVTQWAADIDIAIRAFRNFRNQLTRRTTA
jgi:hypothetical protein